MKPILKQERRKIFQMIHQKKNQ